MFLAPNGDRLETRVHAERAQDVANVVANRLDAQVQFASNLVGRTAVLEQSQHFGLPRCQVRMRGPRRGLLDIGDLAEHTDDVIAAA